MRRSVIFLLPAALFALMAETSLAAGRKPVVQGEAIGVRQAKPPVTKPASITAFSVDWSSISTGGVLISNSPTYRLGGSIGETDGGSASSPSYQTGTGFWYLATGLCASFRGDMNGSGNFTPADVVLMLNCVFLDTGICDQCFTDVNCSGSLSAADVVIELNAVFLSTPPPC